ncbi:3',5'-cyclic-nucleotide phosphodiesterase, partial [Tulasnella sp. 408]
MEQGAKGILTPPFTPDAVLGTFATALNVKPTDISATSPTTSTRKDSMGDGSLFASLSQYALPAASQPPLAALRIPPSVIRGNAAHTPVRSALPSAGSPGSIYHHFKPLPPLPLITPRSSLSQSSPLATTEIEVKVNVDTQVESVSQPTPAAGVQSQPKPESPASMSASAQSDLNKVTTTTSQPVSPKAEPPTPTPQPPSTLPQQQSKPKNLRLPSALPLAADLNQPLPSEQRSLPPLSPPVQKDAPPSPTSPELPTKPALTSSISMSAAVSTNAPPASTELTDPFYDFTFVGPRRRSVDTGGLALALKASSDDCLFGLGTRGWTVSAFGPGAAVGGWGWGGWEELDSIEGPLFAELLSDMYVHTQNTTDEALVHFTSPFPLHPSTRRRLIHHLSRWDFEPHNLTSDELLECAFIVFEALFRIEGMSEDSQIPVEQLETQFRPFISAVRSIYHSQNKYHNFQHAIDVLQAVYSFLVQAECVPPLTILLDRKEQLDERQEGELRLPLPSGYGSSKAAASEGGSWSRKERKSTLIQQVLDNRDLLALCLAALGHDVGHPGLSNAFMKNARTPLSVVYDDKSTLEQMHCALLLQLMRKHGLGHLIATSSEISTFATMATPCTSSNDHNHGFKCSDAKEFRNTLVQTVLITDMSLHFGWMGKLGALAKDVEKGEALTKNSLADVKMTVCQALIKCGDISNPARPHAVSEHWSSALLEEWSCQAMLERELGLPVSVAASADEVTQAKGQIGFIDLFTKPLFDTTSSVIPSMEVFARQGDINRAQWQQRLDKCLAAAENAAPR